MNGINEYEISKMKSVKKYLTMDIIKNYSSMNISVFRINQIVE